MFDLVVQILIYFFTILPIKSNFFVLLRKTLFPAGMGINTSPSDNEGNLWKPNRVEKYKSNLSCNSF